MLKLKKIQSDASWGKVVDDINGNNGAIVTAVEMSKFANVDWGDEVAFPIVNAISSSATLQHNTCYLFGEVEQLNITLDSDDTPLVKVYIFQFHSGATPTRLSVPSSVEWANDPIIRANRVYQVTIIDGYATYREFLFNTTEIPTTEIWYTSLDGNVVEPYSKTVFGAPYDSSTYKNGKGIMTFTGEVTKIGASAFDGKTTLTSVTPPSSVKQIGDYAFRGCTALTKVVIPDGVTTLGGYAFYQCSALKSIVIPDSVTQLGAFSCFASCSSLTSVKLSKNVKTIPYTCFYNCAIESIEIPYGVTEIGIQAFRICNSLRSVVIPDSVTIINDGAFRQDSNLETVVLSDNLETLGVSAFQDCSALTSINIPSLVTSIGSDAFYNCKKLMSVTFESTTPPTIGTTVFNNTSSSLRLRVPSSAEEAYKAAYPAYASKIVGY